jgi:hypothetical protein
LGSLSQLWLPYPLRASVDDVVVAEEGHLHLRNEQGLSRGFVFAWIK